MKKYPHETTVLGVFPSSGRAFHAMHEIENFSSIAHEDLSVISNLQDYENQDYIELPGGQKLHESAWRAGKMGGLIGALAGGAVVAGSVITGGLSLLLAAPLAAIASGAGGALGGLIGAGFTEDEAQAIDDEIAAGKHLVLVHARNHKLAQFARETLLSEGAQRVKVHH